MCAFSLYTGPQSSCENHSSLSPALGRKAPYPVHYERLAHVQPLLEKPGCNSHGVEVAETPAGKNQEKRRKKNIGLDQVLFF